MTAREAVKLGPQEKKALAVLVKHSHEDENAIYFRTVAKYSGLTLIQSRRAVRSLARKGLAEYRRGLFTDDGEVAGSSYCCNSAGRAALREGEG